MVEVRRAEEVGFSLAGGVVGLQVRVMYCFSLFATMNWVQIPKWQFPAFCRVYYSAMVEGLSSIGRCKRAATTPRAMAAIQM